MDNIIVVGKSSGQSQPDATRRLRIGWVWRFLAWILASVLLLVGLGAAWQAIGTRVDERAYPPPGQMVNVGGYKMHILCQGEGSPTVILDHVGDGNLNQWALIQPAVAQQTRVCSYDRAGFGWSEASPAPRDAEHNVQELHTLLAKAGIDGPYLFVGHSFGANVARVYAADFPEQTAGLVLVDPGIVFGRPDVPPAIDAQWRMEDMWFMTSAPWLARIGLLRLAGALGLKPGYGDLPGTQGQAFVALQRSDRFYSTLKAEALALAATSEQVLAAEAALHDQPLIVLSAARPEKDRGREAWTAVNAGIAARSTNGVHYVVPGSEHIGLAIDKQEAAVTTGAILEMLNAVRAGRPLNWQQSQ